MALFSLSGSLFHFFSAAARTYEKISPVYTDLIEAFVVTSATEQIAGR
jgi:hypothetical protein